MLSKSTRAYDGAIEVSKLMHYEHLPRELMEKHQGYPEYWQKKWVTIRVFKTDNEASVFMKENG